MNERIQELMDQAGIDVEAVENLGEMPTALKFAELIVRECMKMCDEVHRDYGMASDTARISKRHIKEHFGVEE